ncbi:glutamine synthetase [Infirmifilum lucidum]|uniref:Glutamine synthetase n=1 Tax=Infirmifilum lucidum TaxID=2776706 RepID=A0A7L9FJX6_9CREN|nr:glutamine synthetase family protein [Infirmifilum lucidum]QOJ79313.1 glutamine synthetase [Infirmifilum lucidum]
MQAAEALEPEERERLLSRSSAKYYSVVFQDLEGRLHERILRATNAGELEEGFRVDGYSVGLANIEDSDLLVKPDFATLRVYNSPFGRTAFLVGDIYYESKPLPYHPRYILKSVAENLNFEVLVGFEVEFYLTRGGKPADSGYYWSPIDNTALHAIAEILEELSSTGVEVRSAHHEVGPGQYEVLPAPMSPVAAADTLLLVKKAIWSVAAKYGLKATFMPKPFTGLPGNGLHLHLSAHKNGRNILSEDGQLREEGLNFIAGLLANARTTALLTNPTVNSYKRLVPGFEAPVLVAWGIGNRSVLVRVPRGLKGASKTVEYRLPDSSGNIYLALTAAILAGVEGLEKRLKAPPPCSENAYRLSGLEAIPRTLAEAVSLARQATLLSGDARKALEMLVASKAEEWENYLKATGASPDSTEVTEWELEKYFDR